MIVGEGVPGTDLFGVEEVTLVEGMLSDLLAVSLELVMNLEGC